MRVRSTGNHRQSPAQQPPGGPGTPGPSAGSSTMPPGSVRSSPPRCTTYQRPRQAIRAAMPNDWVRPRARYTTRAPATCQYPVALSHTPGGIHPASDSGTTTRRSRASPGGAPQPCVRGHDVFPVLRDQAVAPVGGRIRDRLDLLVRHHGEERGHRQLRPPWTIPAHRSVISSWNSGLRADGRWVVWCCPARAGGTATTSGHAAGVGLEAGVTPVGGAPADGDRADGAAAAADAAACCPCPAPAAWEQPASSPPALISPQAAAIRTAPGRGPGAVPCLKHFTRSW